AWFIFVVPPDRESLKGRLQLRGTEAEADMEERLENAAREMQEAPWYDYVIINDVFEQALKALTAIVLAARCCRKAVLPRLLHLLQPH
ncbi:MAG: guanylate kinase, partial [Syntrophobacteria bacterium]